MAAARLTFEQRKCILNWFMKFDNAVEVQRQWRREFETEPPTRLTINRIVDKFEMHGAISGRFTKEDREQLIRSYQQKGALTHYQLAVLAFLDENLQGHWIGRRGPIEFPPRSPKLTPMDFYLWGTVKDQIYRRKPRTLEELRQEITVACTAI
ncbi:hypothetical protein C0J52_24624 [Blattella germanica]|nr:hypothetical protein C0J52_24624 [Blattella germanica]PSN34915.1 hypothetical protein C0J52_24624 [Blattella germanica]PSN34916.1 hypothetical protein C0J52_24624 [Blattella germanica]PSN34917.1 hypothetical protein C0J52_24624 [Blattella germanica]PSN34918.1 hypothetical protein C0J52_24624 [Blattella germanica]